MIDRPEQQRAFFDANGYLAGQTPSQPEPLKPGERPPIDPDAT